MAAAASSPNSATNSQCSTSLPDAVKQEQPQDVSSEIMEPPPNEVKTEPMDDSKEVKTEPKEEPIDIMDSEEHIEKFKRYEAEFRQYLMSKYFSDKNIFGGNIFDVKMNIDGQTITASRLPPYQSYLDPATFDALISKESGPSAETPTTSTSNGKSPTQGN
ncbi:hypothetical protein ABFS82_07G052400 [Erythranthe guttata]|uniref:Uncharacterized protein n=1 Tax=Erythranthe guttata TaxID=4155 RepID=A0A022RT91_ERYGU|nr:PREDICTED: uncharacterized protein LOC105950056 [Erythranthe guttata]EYU43747.1 hypothetical protein MIMGU_mgv1a015346mg [Erythranthe guttata]|eukprot:XP_012828834.1 PREDICTED: uncharacterized protein LOC105950056 [Erythranthe guttata]